MKIQFYTAVISPEVGCRIAGYGRTSYTVTKLDDLKLSMLLLDDGEKKAMLLGFDLLGMNPSIIRQIRQICATRIGTEEAAILLSCTHTHCGPHTRSLTPIPEGTKLPTAPEGAKEKVTDTLNKPYVEFLLKTVADSLEILLKREPIEVNTYFYSGKCNLNRNRRLVTAGNCCTFLPHRRDMNDFATGFTDQEVGMLFFYSAKNGEPVYSITNWAAHPLAGHCPGIGGARISADFPAVCREYVQQETGAEAMYLSGACGDLVPENSETGVEAINAVGRALGRITVDGMCTAQRCMGTKYRVEKPRLGWKIREFQVGVRKNAISQLVDDYPLKDGKVTLSVQLLCVGDVCFAGMPGELFCELGQEIKWHSPFRKTFVLYASTAYFNYLGCGNALVAGGYEALNQPADSRTGLKIVNETVDAAYELRQQVFPEDGAEYPDNLEHKTVALFDKPATIQ